MYKREKGEGERRERGGRERGEREGGELAVNKKILFPYLTFVCPPLGWHCGNKVTGLTDE